MASDYRVSHTSSDKGAVYDRRFETFGWRQYLWQKEQAVLHEIINTYFSDNEIHYLDFACGTGRILGAVKDRVHRCLGIDVSDSMLQQCRQKYPDACVVQADITRDDVLAGQQFNLITAFRFFPNAEPQLRLEAIDALAWHLSHDGLFVFNNHRNQSCPLFGLARLLGRPLHTMHNQEVDALLDAAGFEIVKTYAFGALPAHDRYPMWIPAKAHELVDQQVNRLGWGRTLCQDTIFVCRKKAPQGIAESMSRPREQEPEMAGV